jgi:hypothetical protein
MDYSAAVMKALNKMIAFSGENIAENNNNLNQGTYF